MNLDAVAGRIQEAFEARNEARDDALRRSRQLIRLCSTAIRASHRDEWEEAREHLANAERMAEELIDSVSPYPDLRYAGYTVDAMKEFAEAHVTLALASRSEIPGPEEIGVSYPAYLNGLCEGASEMRRRCLDELRQGNTDEAERLLRVMDDIYDMLGTFDFPNAITGGLRRRVDQLRGVIERTRGDLTNSLRQDRLVRALERVEERFEDAGLE